MKLGRCPKCGRLLINEDYCYRCGETLNETIESEKKDYNVTVLGTKLTVWNYTLMIIINVSLVLFFINIFFGEDIWSFYPIMAMFWLYFITFTAFSKNIEQLTARLRNATLITNLLAIIFTFSFFIFGGKGMWWVLTYYMPITIIVLDIFVFSMLIVRKTHIFSALIVFLLNLPQISIPLMLLLLEKRLGIEIPINVTNTYLILISFGLTLISLIDLAFVYVIRCKNKTENKFKFWQ